MCVWCTTPCLLLRTSVFFRFGFLLFNNRQSFYLNSLLSIVSPTFCVTYVDNNDSDDDDDEDDDASTLWCYCISSLIYFIFIVLCAIVSFLSKIFGSLAVWFDMQFFSHQFFFLLILKMYACSIEFADIFFLSRQCTVLLCIVTMNSKCVQLSDFRLVVIRFAFLYYYIFL